MKLICDCGHEILDEIQHIEYSPDGTWHACDRLVWMSGKKQQYQCRDWSCG